MMKQDTDISSYSFITLAVSSRKRNETVWRLASICTCVCSQKTKPVFIFSNLNRARAVYSIWLTKGSTQRGQRKFPSEYYEDGHLYI